MILATTLQAQIIGEVSADIDEPERPLPLRSIEFGVSGTDFSPRHANSLSEAFVIDRNSFAINLYQEQLLFYFDYSRGKISGETTTFLNGGVRIDFPLFETTNSAFSPIIPISLVTDFILVSVPDNVEKDNLSISSIGIGGGAGFCSSFGKATFLVKAVPFIAFATQAFSANSGSSKGFTINTLFQFARVFGDYGLALSYRYKHISTSFNNSRYDYLLKSHALTLGVSF
ncbi:hypothetical protein [Chloroherpeton thalassium]|nr:hypothetical protein [Chloroherpeton thalassium]